MAGRLRLPGLRKQERGPAQAAALRPPVPRLQEADLGGGRDVHAPLARAIEELASGSPHHDFAFERDVGLAAAAPSGPGELKVGLDAGAEDPPGGRSREGRLMIAGAVEVFGENSPGCVKLRRIMDQSGPTLKAFLEDATEPGTWIAADGWAGCDGLENRTAIAVGDRPAHEVLEWIRRVFSNLKRWGLGVLHGFRRKHLDWQLVEWLF